MTKVLIVEDDPDAAEALSEILRGGGYQTSTAETAGDAHRLVDCDKPDVLLIDVGLPDDNGIHLARMLGVKHALPVVIMTAQASFGLDEPLGANPFVKLVVFKPCSSRTLLRAISDAAKAL